MNQQIQKANNLQEQRDSAWNEIARLREKIQDLEGYTNHLKDNLNDAVNSSIYNNGLVEKLEK
jgi:predicted  nucleic acid-binding Zn-ribbon protein